MNNELSAVLIRPFHLSCVPVLDSVVRGVPEGHREVSREEIGTSLYERTRLAYGVGKLICSTAQNAAWDDRARKCLSAEELRLIFQNPAQRR